MECFVPTCQEIVEWKTAVHCDICFGRFSRSTGFRVPIRRPYGQDLFLVGHIHLEVAAQFNVGQTG